ncbi:MAG: orotate phosphoribosyltransferase [Cellvibrionales bacterium]|nr:orotate phosphoribosyltransferase [Cellvibrionales bacterium]
MAALKPYQQRFIDLAIQCRALQFGDFQLKSGRRSPYFFNAGQFNSGPALAALGGCYADAFIDSGVQADMLFGPAYKGIPLVAATAIALAERGRDLPFCFNRKEAKPHGEGGWTIGAPLRGRVLILDDVLTAGTAINATIELLATTAATPAAALIGFDRQERIAGDHAAATELTATHGLRILSIAGLDNLCAHLKTKGDKAQLAALDSYREKHGAI